MSNAAETVRNLFNRVVSEQKRLGLRWPHLIRPALPGPDAAEVLKELPICLPESLRAVYAFCDGAEHTSETEVGHFAFLEALYELLSLSSAIELYRFLVDELSEQYPDIWEKTWFPFAESAFGDMLFVDVAKITAGDVPVIEQMHGEDPRPRYDGIIPMLKTMLNAYEQGVISPDPDGIPRMTDLEQYNELLRANNPLTHPSQ